MTDFTELGLPETLLRALEADHFKTPTQIQEKSIPVLLDGKDFIGLAETGTGKTAAFLLPLMANLFDSPAKRAPGKPRALILAPTRELAQQIIGAVETLGRFIGLRSTVIFGGVAMHKQTRRLNGGLDILVATPGRLMDHYRQGNVSFDETEFFILDEADRMLDMGFINDVKYIASELPDNKQTVLFSATMSKAVDKLSRQLLDNPERIDVTSKVAVTDSVTHKLLHVEKGKKKALLMHILKDNAGQVIIFTKTKRGADKLSRDLSKGPLKTDAIHGDRNQRQRQRTLNRFREGEVDILIATDVAARGIDVPGIDKVINFDLPLEPEAYIHRVGRTGRNGATGNAYSLCTPDDLGLLRDIEKLLQQQIDIDADNPYHSEPPATFSKSSNSRSRGRGRSSNSGSRSGGRSSGRSNGRSGGRHGERSGGRSDGRSNPNSNPNSGRRSEGRSEERSGGERDNGHSGERSARRSGEQTRGRSDRRSGSSHKSQDAGRGNGARKHTRSEGDQGAKRRNADSSSEKFQEDGGRRRRPAKATPRTEGKSFSKAGKATGKPNGKPGGKPTGKSNGKPGGKSFGKPNGKLAGKSNGRANGKFAGKPAGKVNRSGRSRQGATGASAGR